MTNTFSRPLLFLLVAPATMLADVTLEGVLGVGGGGALQSGDRAAFQAATQHRKDGVGGIEEFRLVRETDQTVLTLEGRALAGDDDYRLGVRFQWNERFQLSAGFEQFRVYYDGSAGFFRPRNLGFKIFDEELSVLRRTLWAEFSGSLENETFLRVRYQRRERDGTKGTTHWADSNLVGAPYTTRNIVPGFYDLHEITDLVTVDVGNEAAETMKWNAGARWSGTTLDNKRFNRRRPFETADRIVTSKDETKTDLFAVHGYYLRQVSEQLTLSGGALVNTLDAHLAGSRIYGQSYDPVFDPAYLRRQQRDEGFYGLEGDAELKQTVLNLNAVYQPTEHWSVRPSVRFENLHQETLAEFIETNIGAGPAFAAVLEEIEGEHDKKWNELAGQVEVRFTGVPRWTFSGEVQHVKGSGTLEEERILEHTGQLTIDRDTEIERATTKASVSTNWYARPGLTVAAQYYYKVRTNDFDTVRDSTPAGSADRYPAYIADQDFETNDVNLRVSWRPLSKLGLVSRYDYQRSTITSQEVGLAPTRSSVLTSHIVSQSATWTPLNRLYLTGNVNVAFDQVATPAYSFVKHGDNNYVTGSVGGGYAIAQRDDVYFEYTGFHASNFIDNSATSLPYGASQKLQQTSVTWTRRQSEHLTFILKYGFLTNRDGTFAGQNDFDAHVLYAKTQYRF